MTVTTTFTYLPNGFTFEHVKYDDGSMEYRLMPTLPAEPAPGDLSRPDAMMQSGPAPVETAPLAASVGPLEPISAPSVPRAAPALIRWVKTTLLTLVGMSAAFLTYVREQIESTSDLTKTIAIGILIGAVVSGGLYGLDRWLRPHAKF